MKILRNHFIKKMKYNVNKINIDSNYYIFQIKNDV